jgi:hypothetical protein
MSTCPFCGIVTDAPHETQEGCIEALHEEIARMRTVLDHVRSAAVPHLPDPEEEDDHEPA